MSSRARALPAVGPTLLAILATLGVVAGLWAIPNPALACATCRVGDPSMTTFGLGQPFAQRLRIGVRYEQRATEIGGSDPDGFRLRHHEVGPVMAYTPTERLTLDLDAPFVHRNVERSNGAVQQSSNLGDMSLGLRVQLLQAKGGGRRHYLWGTARLRAPTAPELHQSGSSNGSGAPLPLEQQTGTGAFGPQFGGGYLYSVRTYLAFVSGRVEIPSRGFQDSRPARGLYATLALQWQPKPWFGLRGSWDHAYEATALEEGGGPDPDSGGFMWGASGSVLLSPMTDLVVRLGVTLPVWQKFDGQHKELPVAVAGVIYDIGQD